jgi:hypothetical protein
MPMSAFSMGMQDMTISGSLIYGLGANLYSLALDTGEKSLLATRSNGSVQDGMTRVNRHRILIGGSGDILDFNVANRSLRNLGKGDYSLALSSGEIIFFYSALRGEPTKLYRAQLREQIIDLAVVDP